MAVGQVTLITFAKIEKAIMNSSVKCGAEHESEIFFCQKRNPAGQNRTFLFLIGPVLNLTWDPMGAKHCTKQKFIENHIRNRKCSIALDHKDKYLEKGLGCHFGASDFFPRVLGWFEF